jgi:oxygen-independent coproporphyrinogen III oxidase
MTVPIDKSTILKYDVQGPRYTSYPTAPEWSAGVTAAVYKDKLTALGRSDKTLSLYVHIPFCEKLCYFCACMKVIRPADEKYGEEYLTHLFKEMELVASAIGRKQTVRQLHWGGGTPTFLSEGQMQRLLAKTCELFDVDLTGEIAIEVDPRTVTASKLKVLRERGFNRVSMGVQDFDDSVMDAVNRHQPFELVKNVTDSCRALKFESVNFDLIYGLPHQTRETFQDTVDQVITLKPDRIALYSFAYVPWLQKHQTKLVQDDFPNTDAKLDIFLLARQKFLDSGYQAIAMDHFALKTDEMARAFNERRLFRNFMGYTVKPADEYLGVGVSAIGFLENTFVQNIKALPEYYKAVQQGDLPVERGKELSEDDRIRRWVILQLMCHFSVDKKQFCSLFDKSFDEYFALEQGHLAHCVEDHLVVETDDTIEVTELGQFFIRNVCMGFDAYLRKDGVSRRFSRTV